MAIKARPFDPKKLKGRKTNCVSPRQQLCRSGAAHRTNQQMFAGLPKGALGFQIKGLKLEELIATNSAILHGSGWTILNFNFRDRKLHNYIVFDQTDSVAFGRPIPSTTCPKHAYHMD